MTATLAIWLENRQKVPLRVEMAEGARGLARFNIRGSQDFQISGGAGWANIEAGY